MFWIDLSVHKTKKNADILGLTFYNKQVKQGKEGRSVGNRAGKQAADLWSAEGRPHSEKRFDRDLKEMGVVPLSGGRTFWSEKTTRVKSP